MLLLPSVPRPQRNSLEFLRVRSQKLSYIGIFFFSIGGAIQGIGHKKVYFLYDNHVTPHLIHGFTPARLHGNPHSNSALFNYSVNLSYAAAGGLICLCSCPLCWVCVALIRERPTVLFHPVIICLSLR